MFLREEAGEGFLHIKEAVKIGVLGIAPASGTTFIATSLAAAMARGLAAKKEPRKNVVGFLELSSGRSRPLIYDSLGMDKRFAGREFIDFYRNVHNRVSIKGCFNLDEGINWVLRIPDAGRSHFGEQSFSAQPGQKHIGESSLVEKIRLIHNVPAQILICDINCRQIPETCEADNRETILDLLTEMDLLLFVIDPLPAKLVFGYPLYCAVRGMAHRGAKVAWVVNKMNSGVNKRELCGFLKLKQYSAIPFINPEDFYAAEYNSRVPYTMHTVAQKVERKLEEIINFHQIYI